MTAMREMLEKHEQEILTEWLAEMSSSTRRSDLLSAEEVSRDASRFLKLLREVPAPNGRYSDVSRPEWDGVRDYLSEISRMRAQAGFSPTDTAMFVFSLKKPVFARMRVQYSKDAVALAEETWRATELLDQLGLYTSEVYQKSREEVIQRQQQDMLELSTPVVKLWSGILALPLIGTLDSARTQVVMESLLQEIVRSEAMVAIIDITGVPTVDTLVAQHLLKTVTAARLMGADCIISGIRPQIAQTIVHLGVQLGDITTKATLADAFVVALQRTGQTIAKLNR